MSSVSLDIHNVVLVVNWVNLVPRALVTLVQRSGKRGEGNKGSRNEIRIVLDWVTKGYPRTFPINLQFMEGKLREKTNSAKRNLISYPDLPRSGGGGSG